MYQLALHATPSGIMVVGTRGEIQFVNQTLADMFGYEIDELLGKPVEILIPAHFASAHRHHVENFARRPTLRSMGSGRDLVGIGKDKCQFPVEIGLRPVQIDSGQFVVATVVDITRRKAIEARLHQHEEQLEELVAERTHELDEAQHEKERMLDQLIQAEKMNAVGTLVSGIGHEINNPLYVLVATAEALAAETSIAQCRAYGNEILKRAHDIAEIVKNLSHYARPGTRHDLQRVDINSSMDHAVHLAQSSLHGNQIEFKIDLDPVPEILAKVEEIQQVLFNVLRNAIQASTAHGCIEIDTSQQGDWVTVRIQDNGTGIPEEYLKQVFDPFFTTKGPDEGEGLGLYIVSQIVNRYQGTIDVENTDDGARFLIRFPIANQNNAEEERL